MVVRPSLVDDALGNEQLVEEVEQLADFSAGGGEVLGLEGHLAALEDALHALDHALDRAGHAPQQHAHEVEHQEERDDQDHQENAKYSTYARIHTGSLNAS